MPLTPGIQTSVTTQPVGAKSGAARNSVAVP